MVDGDDVVERLPFSFSPLLFSFFMKSIERTNPQFEEEIVDSFDEDAVVVP